MKIVSINSKGEIVKIFNQLPIIQKIQVKQKINVAIETLQPLEVIEQGKMSVDDYRFAQEQAIKAWREQPRTEVGETDIEVDDVIEGRHIASWIAAGQTEELVNRGLRVVQRDEEPEFEPRNSSLKLNEVQIGDKVLTETWEVVPLEPQIMAELISNECSSRIIAQADTNTQMNMTAAAVAGALDAAGKKLYADSLQWVNDMRSASKELIRTNDPDYFQDEKWPEPTDELKAFAAQF